jgi:hypothetical protein
VIGCRDNSLGILRVGVSCRGSVACPVQPCPG